MIQQGVRVVLEALINNKINNNFSSWDTWHIQTWVNSYEEFTLTSHQINNLHLYYQAIEELYNRFPEEKRYQYRHWYFSEENPTGTYIDYLNWRKNIK